MRGRQLLRDDALGFRAFEACETEGGHGAPIVEWVDHSRVIVERMGRMRPSGDELRRIFQEHAGKLSTIRGFVTAGPGRCVAGVHAIEGDCVTVGVTTVRAELSTLVSDVAATFGDSGATCVPVVIEAGRERQSLL